MVMWGNDISNDRRETTEQVMEFKYLENRISEFEKNAEYRLQTHNRTKSIRKRNFGEKMTIHSKLEDIT